ncbi:MAG: hypothetical protein GX222_04295 [Ruminococcaceae bacterium]|nr:hypothetical protein [Oscillospiraceae bacterium]
MTENRAKKIDFNFLIIGAAVVAGWMLFMHVDVMETANHAYIFLESLFSGRPLDFYSVVSAHENSYYYINNAHYNIAVYLLFGLWELPVFAVNAVFSLPLNEGFLWLWAKGLCVAAFIGCYFIIKKLADFGNIRNPKIVAIAFLLNPAAYFMPVAVGQYDVLCIFFILLSLVYFLKGDSLRFSVIMGVGILLKSFAVLAFIPLLLYKEKKLKDIIKYMLVGFSPYLITYLLYRGRTGDADYFNNVMMGRLFEIKVGQIPLFPLFFALLCLVCWSVDFEKNRGKRLKTASFICLFVFVSLLLSIYWHPQWAFLVTPFLVISAFSSENKTLYLYLNIFFSAGVFLHAWRVFPGHFEFNMLFYGIFYALGNKQFYMIPYRTMSSIMASLPVFWHVASSLVFVASAAVVLAYLPLPSLGRISDRRKEQPKKMLLCLYLGFLIPISFWAVSALISRYI